MAKDGFPIEKAFRFRREQVALAYETRLLQWT